MCACLLEAAPSDGHIPACFLLPVISLLFLRFTVSFLLTQDDEVLYIEEVNGRSYNVQISQILVLSSFFFYWEIQGLYGAS